MTVDRSANARIGGKYRARHAWERQDGAQRMRTADVALGTDAPLATIYRARRWAGGATPPTTPAGAWETLAPEDQLAAERALKIHTGGDIEFMARAYGAAIDQKYMAPQPVPASLATPYSTTPVRSPARLERSGVLYGPAVTSPKIPHKEPGVAQPANDTLRAVKEATPVSNETLNQFLPHLQEPEDHVADKVPHYHSIADFARRKALTERGLGA